MEARDDLLLRATDLPYKKVCGATKSLLCAHLQYFPTMSSCWPQFTILARLGAMKTADSATANVHQKQVVVSIILYHKLYGYQ